MSTENSGSFRSRGRRFWLQLHRWIGLLLLILLIPLSLSGSLLVWDEWTDGWINPQRYVVSGKPDRPLSDYVAQARIVLNPTDRIASVAFPAEEGKPLVVTAAAAPQKAQGRSAPPSRAQVWLDPATGRVLDHADMDTGLLRVLHRFHGSLMVPDYGRAIVGWLGIAMLVSSLTGLWLWLPVTGSLRKGFRWNRAPSTSGRLHHQFGFWIAIPLAILSFTGAYISFPSAAQSVESLFTGAQRAGGPPAAGRASPAADVQLSPDEAVAKGQAAFAGARPLTLRWPTERAAEWTITIDQAGSRRDVVVDDRSGKVRPSRTQSGAARFMRTLHDGTGYNPLWQTIIFLGGLVPALLGITGLLMWLRGRTVRRRFEAQPAAA